MRTMRERIEESVSIVPVTGCWMWMHRINHRGYGVVSVGDRKISSHRAAYESFVGPIPDGLQLDHKCRNRWCANPDHLDPVTQEENQKRSPLTNSGKLSCKRGHDFSESNTYRWNGARICRPCRRMREKGEV